MKHKYTTRGVCASKITFELNEEKKINNVRFVGGCDGNLKGIAALAEGMDAGGLASKLNGVRCGRKKSSCPDQFALAIEQALQS